MRPVPAFLHEKLEAQYGPSLAARIEGGYRANRVTTLRVNALKATRDDVRERLSAAGLRLEAVSWYPDALIVTGLDETRARTWMEQHDTAFASQETDSGAPAAAPRRLHAADVLRTHPLYADGAIYLQNLSAMIPALAVAPRSGQAVLDMCAAPGGKTCQLAALSQNAALITACEKNPLRAERLRYNLEKQGAHRVNVMVTDARRLDPLFSFDAVLLDAPCSGSGTVQLADERQAKKQRFSAELLARTVRAQRALLARALEAVPAGGVVTYSTCSVLADENEEVVKAALEGTLLQGTSDAQPGNGNGARSERRNRKGRHGRKGARNGKAPAAARYGAWDDGWDEDSPTASAKRKRAAAARRSPACELVPLDPERFAGVPLLPAQLDETLCVRPTERYEGFFVAQLKRL